MATCAELIDLADFAVLASLSGEPLIRAQERTTNVVRILPNDPSIVRLIGAMMLEQNDEMRLKPTLCSWRVQTVIDAVRTRLFAVAR